MCTGNAGVAAGAGEDVLGGILAATGAGAPIGAGLIASGTGTALNAYAQNQALKQQDNIAAQGIIKQAQLQKTGSNDVAALTNQVAQSNAKTQAASSAQLKAYQDALQQGAGISSSASPNVPGASKAYKAEQGVAGNTASNYVNAIANSAATTEGTQLERVNEGEQMGATATNLGQLQGQSNEQNYLTKLGIQSTQANPWLEGLGTLLQAGGAAYGATAGLGGVAGSAESAAEAAPGAVVGLPSDAAGEIALANPLSGLSSMAQSGASAASSAAGLGSFGGGSGGFLSSIANAIQFAQSRRQQQQNNPYITGNTVSQ
jgi:hypothetical protein